MKISQGIKKAESPDHVYQGTFRSKEMFAIQFDIQDLSHSFQSNCILRQKGKKNGGERGIRTLGEVAPTAIFETAALDHSAISPEIFL